MFHSISVILKDQSANAEFLNNMIIGYDGSRAFSEDRTGTENYSYQLLKHLAKIDTEDKYIVYVRHGVVKDGFWPANFQFRTINLPRFWTQAGLAARIFKDPLDVLFVPAHTLPLFRKPGLKTVVVVHDLGAEYLPQMHQFKQRLYLRAMTRFQLKQATRIIAVSKATKRDLVERAKLPPENIQVIYEGVDQVFFKPQKGDTLRNILKQYYLEKNSYFLFVGTIQPRKNLERLIMAYNGLRGDCKSCPKLVIAGGKGWLSERIYQLPAKLGIADHVEFLGRVADDVLPALYSGAIALTFPSLFEGFGLPILEAMSCGCPVLTSKTSSLPEVAGKAAVLVDPTDTESIKNGMAMMLNQDLRSKLVLAGFEQAAKFTWETCAMQTLGLLKSCKKANIL